MNENHFFQRFGGLLKQQWLITEEILVNATIITPKILVLLDASDLTVYPSFLFI